jgi:hypothetical protein
MPLVPRKSALAIAAVVDIALNAGSRPVRGQIAGDAPPLASAAS